ncbi:cytoskeletal protein Sojo-like [Corticium candelabrum]|uniref:cytoskeletal protein Sojo-like n=1 Tax=Corticium candelabrum TaxID=121492 RepID=UPI002E262720|nr:cytoskeletal protein Sojo-like [Corticium candelabrum]
MSSRMRSSERRGRPQSAMSTREVGSSTVLRRSAGSIRTQMEGRRTPVLRLSTDVSVRKPSTRLAASGELDSLESEYIKNLQQQIYFLELEVNYLREQINSKKSPPRLATPGTQVEKWTQEVKGLKHQVESLQAETTRKDSALDRLDRERQRLTLLVEDEKASFSQEKQALIEEIVTLKKHLELQTRSQTQQSHERLRIKDDSRKSYTALIDTEKKAQILRDQLEHRAGQMKELRLQLEEKRTENVKLQTHIQELEHNYLDSDSSKTDEQIKQLEADLRQLRLELKQAEMNAEQDRHLKNKVMEDCTSLVKENALLASQVAELQKQVDRERSHRDNKQQRNTLSLQELVTLREHDKQQAAELQRVKSSLKYEQEKLQDATKQIIEHEQETAQTQEDLTSVTEQLQNLERLHTDQEQENIALRRDKVLLVDHVTEWQQKVESKDEELLQLNAELAMLRGKLSEMTAKARLQKSLEALKWDEFERMADAIKTVSSQGRELASSLTEEQQS